MRCGGFEGGKGKGGGNPGMEEREREERRLLSRGCEMRGRVSASP